MKKKFTRWLVVMMSIIMVLSTSLGVLAAGDGDGGAVANAKYKDGTYTATEFTFVKKSTGKPGKSTFTLDKNEVVVQDGIAYVSVTTSSTSTTKVAVGGVDYAVNGSKFKIPTALNEDVTVTITTTAMSSPTDVDYIMHVTADVPLAETEPESNIPEDGEYKVAVTTNSKMFKVVDATLTVKKGVATALVTLSGTGYDYLYVGSATDATTAGESAWCGVVGTVDYVADGGVTKTGAQFSIPVSALDQDLRVASHAVSSGAWSDRTMNFSSASLEKVESEKVVWKDGYYTATATVPDGTDVSGDKYPKQGYDIDITVQIKDGKIVDLQYTDKLEMDGNYPYKVWTMDGHYSWEEDDASNGNASTWSESWTYVPGMREQVVEANSADVDVVTSATKLSKAVKSAVTEALKKAETGETGKAPYKPEVVPETTPVIASDGVYDVVADLENHTVVDAKLTSKDGKMTALITLTGTGYDYMYFGTEAEAYVAGSGSMIRYIGIKEYQNASGATKKGYQFLVPVESLDKDIDLIVHAKSGNNWFERTIRFDSSTLKKVTWQDGSYTTKATVLDGTKISGDKYPATGYDLLMTVEIKDGKIADVRYAENLANDGNISYKEWAMDGHYQYAEDTDTWTYCKGITEQAVTGNSPQVDAVSTATKVSKAINVGLYAALDRAETGDVDTETPMPEVKPETENVIAEPGVYKVAAADVETTLGLADTVDVQITSKDGAMTALITWSGSGSYDYLYVGTEEEAYKAGKAGLCSPIGTLNFINSSGKEKTGSQFEIPLTSLDKDILVLAHAKSSDNWFHRTLKINKEDLVLVEELQPDTPDADTETIILPDGTYSVAVDTGAKMFKVVDCKLVVEGEKVTAVVTLSSNGYDYLYTGTKEQAEAAETSAWSKWVKEIRSGDKTQRVYTLSMSKEDLTKGLAVASHSESNNTWFDRSMTFDVDSLKVYSVGTSVEDAINNVVSDKVEDNTSSDNNTGSTDDPSTGTTDKDNTLTEDEINDKLENVDDEEVVKDGTYKPEFGFTGGSGRATISCNKVVVKDGKATATITFSSPNFTWVKSLGKTVTNANKGGNSTFTIPVNLNGKTNITAETTAMSQPYEVEYTLYCFIDGTKVTTSNANKSDDVIELEGTVAPDKDDATAEDNAWGAFDDETETEDVVADATVQSNDALVKALTVALILVCVYAAAGTIFAVAKMRKMKGE